MLIRLLIPFQIFFMLFELSAGEESVTVVLFTQPSKSTYSVPIKIALYKKKKFFTLIDFFKPLDIQGLENCFRIRF